MQRIRKDHSIRARIGQRESLSDTRAVGLWMVGIRGERHPHHDFSALDTDYVSTVVSQPTDQRTGATAHIDHRLASKLYQAGQDVGVRGTIREVAHGYAF
jgi:hypothetical protein